MPEIIIPVYKPTLSGREKEYVNDCIDSTWISSKGKYISAFETAFAQYIEVGYAASVCNGTVALHLALLALGINKDDEVIVPTLTYIAAVNCISYVGASPVFVDSEAGTWQMDPAKIEARITPKTRAIIAVHVYGHLCNMEAIMAIAQKHGLYVIEDCAEAIGSQYKGRKAGSFGHIATFSFFGNKTITCGEGGMVVTRDKTLFERTQRYKGQGLAMHREYWHDLIGYNYRMTNICAAIGLAQLEQVDSLLRQKRQVAMQYKAAFEGSPLLSFHDEAPDYYHSYWMCSILVNNEKDRNPLRRHLAERGIETRPVFYPVHTMPIYASRFEQFQTAQDIAERGINLPSYASLSEESVNLIITTIHEYFS